MNYASDLPVEKPKAPTLVLQLLRMYVSENVAFTYFSEQKHVPWTPYERKAVFSSLGIFIRKGVIPGKNDCVACKRKSGHVLDGRDWKAIKYFVKNQITKRLNATAV